MREEVSSPAGGHRVHADLYRSVRGRSALLLRFGMGEGDELTLEKIGERFAVTRGRIRQIETKALRNLRHPLRSQRLRVFAGAL